MSTPLLIPEPPLQVLRGLAKEIGLNEAIVLQQVHYRQHQRDGVQAGGWLRRTYVEWHRADFPFWSPRTIERIFNNLREKDLLTVETGGSTDRALLYRVNYEAIPSRQFDGMEDANLTRQSDGMTMKKEKRSSPSGEDMPALSEQVREVFEHWKAAMGLNGNAKLTADRRQKVVARLKEGLSIEEIKRAIDGVAASEYHRARHHDDLELICRKGSNVQRYAKFPLAGEGTSEHQQQVAAALAAAPQMSDEEIARLEASVGLEAA